MKEQRADTVIKSANGALGATILLWRVGTGEAKDGAVGRKKIADGDVVKLLTVVSLQGENRTTELLGNVAENKKFPTRFTKII